MPGFHRRGPEIDLDLSAAETGLLTLALPVLEVAPAPALFPGPAPARYPHFRAHPGDDAAEGRFRELTEGSLAADRDADRRRFAASLERGTLGAEDAAAWLRVLGEARLALAARLGLAEEGAERAPLSPGLALLHLFGCVQDELATTLLGS
jgi:hypothetical protein